MKNKTKEDIRTDIEDIVNPFLEKWCSDDYQHLVDNDENDGQRLRNDLENLVLKYSNLNIKKNFVAKGEVREMIEDIQATEIADHSLASLIEKLYKYKKSLE